MGERSIECGECKRAVKVVYKEVVGQTISCTEMCEECPLLKSKLYGDVSGAKNSDQTLCCGVCGTSLESVKMGQPVGCAECYTVFADYIMRELIDASGIPLFLRKKAQAQKLQTVHIGRSPHQPSSPVLSTKLSSLNEALNEALKKENYEQAASIRDQIKALTDNHD